MSSVPSPRVVGERRWVNASFGLLAWIVGLAFFFPVFWMVLNSFKSEQDANTSPKLFFHPTLDSLGLDLLPRRLTVRPGEQHDDLSIPSAWTVVTQLCRGTPMKDSTGLLLGHVRDADNQLPRTGTVTVFWMELVIGEGGVKQNRQQIPIKTDDAGWLTGVGAP